MVYIYLPAAYYHLNLDVTKDNLLAAWFSAIPAVFLVFPFKIQSSKTACFKHLQKSAYPSKISSAIKWQLKFFEPPLELPFN